MGGIPRKVVLGKASGPGQWKQAPKHIPQCSTSCPGFSPSWTLTCNSDKPLLPQAGLGLCFVTRTEN